MKKIIALVLAVCFMVSLAACASDGPAKDSLADKKVETKADAAKSDAPKAEAAKPASDELYVEVSALGNLDYFYDHKLGMEMAGKVLGVKTEYVGPAEYDMNAMIAAFEQSIAKKPAGIVVVGFEDSLNAIVDKTIAGGIPVVTVDADLPKSKRIAFVGTGNKNAGIQGGLKLAALIGEKGKVAIATKPGQSNLEERVAGYKEAFAKYPGIEVVQIIDTQSDPVKAAEACAAVLQKNPDLVGIACVEAAGGAGAATAVKEANKIGKVKIIAMDRGNEVCQKIKDGSISASVAQQTALMPFYATQILYNLKHTKIDITADNVKAGITGTPSVIDTGAVIVDEKNVDMFIRK